MQIKIKKADIEKDAQLLFDLDVKIFTRDIDIVFPSVDKFVKFFKNDFIYLVYDGKKPIGFFTFKTIGKDKGEIVSMGLLSQYHNRGIGKKIMKKALSQLKNRKLKIVTHPQNSGAIILYLKSGFKVKGWKDNYFGDGQPRLSLELEN